MAKTKKEKKVLKIPVTINPEDDSTNLMRKATGVDAAPNFNLALSEALSLSRRRKLAQLMRRKSVKMQIAKKITRTKFASDAKLKARASRMARAIFRKRMAGKRGENYKNLAPGDKIAIDKVVDTAAPRIVKLAKRLFPVVRKNEGMRLQKLRKGKKKKDFTNRLREDYIDALTFELMEGKAENLDRLLKSGLADKEQYNVYKRALANPEQNVRFDFYRKKILKMLDKLVDIASSNAPIFIKTKSELEKSPVKESLELHKADIDRYTKIAVNAENAAKALEKKAHALRIARARQVKPGDKSKDDVYSKIESLHSMISDQEKRAEDALKKVRTAEYYKEKLHKESTEVPAAKPGDPFWRKWREIPGEDDETANPENRHDLPYYDRMRLVAKARIRHQRYLDSQQKQKKLQEMVHKPNKRKLNDLRKKQRLDYVVRTGKLPPIAKTGALSTSELNHLKDVQQKFELAHNKEKPKTSLPAVVTQKEEPKVAAEKETFEDHIKAYAETGDKTHLEKAKKLADTEYFYIHARLAGIPSGMTKRDLDSANREYKNRKAIIAKAHGLHKPGFLSKLKRKLFKEEQELIREGIIRKLQRKIVPVDIDRKKLIHSGNLNSKADDARVAAKAAFNKYNLFKTNSSSAAFDGEKDFYNKKSRTLNKAADNLRRRADEWDPNTESGGRKPKFASRKTSVVKEEDTKKENPVISNAKKVAEKTVAAARAKQITAAAKNKADEIVKKERTKQFN